MRKILISLIILLLSLNILACNSDNNHNQDDLDSVETSKEEVNNNNDASDITSIESADDNNNDSDGLSDMIVMNLYDNSFLVLQDDQEIIGVGELISIRKSDQEITIGKIYSVELEDQIATSYPPQAVATKMELLEDALPGAINFEMADKIMQHLPEKSHLIDVRSKSEYDGGHVPGAILLPLENIDTEIEISEINQDDIIIVYCFSGARSHSAANLLRELGYKVVLDAGGILNYTGELEY
ncbi:MAG: rhodanese-like domain-containing protein [Clostridiaceae bacterium]|nr:rhodanese-like domain-containing protein [Clostridiaceae bacterium]